MIKVKIGNRIISHDTQPYIIAEVGVNHECSLINAKRLILNAKLGGADCVKFQTYKAELIASKFAPAYWDIKKEKTKNQYELFKQYDHFEFNDYLKLSKFCKKIKINFASTPFDVQSVDMLDKLVNFFKISSSDITNFPLLKKIASKNKTILLSTGASTIKEIEDALKILGRNKSTNIVLMHCILNYPTNDFDANLNMIIDLKNKFPNNVIGYSDHTLPSKEMTNITTAYALGARVIEKHFTLDKKKTGNDHYHSMDINDLKNIKKRIFYLYKIIGNKEKNFINSEKKSRKYARRSLVINRYVKKNEVVRESDLICKRPGFGIQPSKIKEIIGKKAKKNLYPDKILKESDFY